jgi:uncharacterized protein YjbI with pentapeptide repeats
MQRISSYFDLLNHLAQYGTLMCTRVDGVVIPGPLPGLMGGTFENCDFSGQSLDSQDLSGTVFIGCAMRDMVLSRVNLFGAEFSRCDLTGSRFAHCDMAASSMTDCTLAQTRFVDCDFEGAELETAA